MTLGFKCNQCDIYFSNLANLKNHFKRTENHEMYFVKKECFEIENDCKIKFYNTKAELNQHLINAHQRNSEFSCNQCDYVATQKGNLKKHIYKKHDKLLRAKEKCNTCKTYFLDLEAHKNRGCGATKRIKCQICQKVCKSHKSLLSHEALAHGNSRRICPICEELLRVPSMLKQHLIRKHGEFDEIQKKKPSKVKNECDICEERFVSKIALKRHLSAEHIQDPLENNGNSNLKSVTATVSCTMCTICNFVALDHNNVMEHIKTHFICENN